MRDRQKVTITCPERLIRGYRPALALVIANKWDFEIGAEKHVVRSNFVGLRGRLIQKQEEIISPKTICPFW
jgi:hypothetical protein